MTTPPPVIRGTAKFVAFGDPKHAAGYLSPRYAVVDLGDEPLPAVKPDRDGLYGCSSAHPIGWDNDAPSARHNMRQAAAVALAIYARDTAKPEPETDLAVTITVSRADVEAIATALLDDRNTTAGESAAARLLSAVRDSGAPAPESEQAAPVAVGDRVVVTACDPRAYNPGKIVGKRATVVAVHNDRRDEAGKPLCSVRLDGGWADLRQVAVRPLTAAEREADAAGENGARS